MEISIKKVGLASTLLVVLLASLAQMPPVYSAEPPVKDKAWAFLSNVVGLNLSAYNIEVRVSPERYTSTFGPDVKEESVLFILDSEQSQMRANFVFENGLLWYCDLSYIKGSPIYTQSPSTNVLDQSKSLIQKYQTYAAQNYRADTSYIQQMKNMLDGVSELKSTAITSGYMKLDTSITTTEQTIRWLYTENGLDIPRKSLALYFRNGTLYFMSDSWNLLTVGSHSLISQEEALSMAWAAAQNYTLKFGSDNGTITEVKPDLSNVTTEVTFSMTTRNSTALYPLWQVKFYFNKVYNNAYGIQVGIWGDTKEVFYCESLITLGGHGGGNPTTSTTPTTPSPVPPTDTPPEPSPSPTEPPPDSPPDNQPPPENNTKHSLNTYLIAGVAAISMALTVVALALKKRRK